MKKIWKMRNSAVSFSLLLAVFFDSFTKGVTGIIPKMATIEETVDKCQKLANEKITVEPTAKDPRTYKYIYWRIRRSAHAGLFLIEVFKCNFLWCGSIQMMCGLLKEVTDCVIDMLMCPRKAKKPCKEIVGDIMMHTDQEISKCKDPCEFYWISHYWSIIW